ncbi:membrane protein [Streptomyces griseoviridis]|nr:membrane protein [Streptomyces griseoviridis]
MPACAPPGTEWALYRVPVRCVPRWALLSSGCAPVLLVAGWTGAASFEGSAYDPLTQTISVLAAPGSPGYWLMTGALLALGVCHLLSAWALRPAATPGRLALGGGGLVAFVVVVLPAPSSGGSLRHGSVAVIGFTLLALWPVLAARGGGTATPWALRPGPALAATAVMAACGLWYIVETQRHGAAGLAERVTTFAQSVWPLMVVTSCLTRAGTPPPRRAERPAGQPRSRP